jgi:N utilization substance protein B
VPGSRRKARAYALQVLYAVDNGLSVSLEEALKTYWLDFQVDVDAEGRRFAEGLVQGTRDRVTELDDTIQGVSKNWRVERMSRVDRNILRLGTYELRYEGAVPARVILNEAIELAKRFGTEDSPAFVNGVLDRIAEKLRPGEADIRAKSDE